MLRTSTHRQRGVSLVELMVGLTVGLIIVAAAASVYVTAVRSGADTLHSAKLNMELRRAMDLMVYEIRRAGYTAGTTNLASNPFMLSGANLTLNGTDCLLFSYDANASGAVNSADFFGFRKNGSAVSMRYGGTAPSTSAGCSVGSDSWEDITDSTGVVVDTLNFSIAYQCWNAETSSSSSSQACASGQSVYDTAAAASTKSDLVEVRDVSINLVGHHISDALTTMSLSQSVKVRNDRVLTVP